MSTTGDATRRTTHPYIRSVGAASSGAPALGPLTQTSSTASDYSTEVCCTFGNDYGDYTGLSATGGFPFATWTRRRGATDDGDALVYVPRPASPPGTTTPSTTTPPTPATPPGQATQPSVAPTAPGLGLTVPRQRRSVVLRRGLLVRAGCRASCRITLTFAVRVRQGTRVLQRTLAHRTVTLSTTRSLRMRLGRAAQRVLLRTPTRSLVLGAAATGVGGVRQTATRRVTLR
jgi:hypothetical protein